MARLKETSGNVAYPVLPSEVTAKSSSNELKLDPKIPQHLVTPTKSSWTPRPRAKRELSKEPVASYAANTARRRMTAPDRRLDSAIGSDLTSATQRKREERTDPSVFQGQIKEREERARYQDRTEEDLDQALNARQAVTANRVPTTSTGTEMIRRMEYSVKTANEALAEATEWFTKIQLERHSPFEEDKAPREMVDEPEASQKNDVNIMQREMSMDESTRTRIEKDMLSPGVTTRRRNKHKKRPEGTRKL